MASPFIPPPTQRKMQQLGINEFTVLDVFRYGEDKFHSSGKRMKIRKYSGYEVGLFYAKNGLTGEYTIIAVWKRDRR